MKLFGITGRAGSGKDTFGEAFTRAGYKRIAFADPLKEATAVIAGEQSHHFFTSEGKEGFSPVLNSTRRIALQRIGSAVRNALDPDVWVRRMLNEWELRGRPPTVITDCRYDNEARLLRSFGATIVRITRPDNELLRGLAAQHESERGIDPDLVDIEIVNDGTIGELKHEARKLIDLASASIHLPVALAAIGDNPLEVDLRITPDHPGGPMRDAPLFAGRGSLWGVDIRDDDNEAIA